MRIFVAALMTETSSFSAVPTSRRSFENASLFRPKALTAEPEQSAYDLIGYGAILRKARERGYPVYTSLHAFAEPGAPSRPEDYEGLRDEILADLRRALPVDAVTLFLHGAQMAQGLDDCEGDIIRRVRAIVGDDCFIGVLLDLHGNTSQAMLEGANALVACRLYPHTDFDSRAEHLFDIAEKYVRGEIRTKHYFHRVPMLGIFYTTLPKMAALGRAADAVEGLDGIHSVSLMHGFPWADQPDTGGCIIVVAEPGHADAAGQARRLAHEFFAARDETRSLRRSIDDILDEIATNATDGTFVIADAADNPGGGAGSDSTFILRRLIERDVQDAALGMVWDPVAVAFAHDAGIGSVMKMRLGGKSGPLAGDPLDVEAAVLSLSDDVHQNDPGGGNPLSIGRSALLGIGGIVVVVNTLRQQVFDPSCFTALGVDMAATRIVVVKSTQHFHELFAPLAKQVFYCDTPGSLTLDFDAGAFKRLTHPIWPLDKDAAPE